MASSGVARNSQWRGLRVETERSSGVRCGRGVLISTRNGVWGECRAPSSEKFYNFSLSTRLILEKFEWCSWLVSQWQERLSLWHVMAAKLCIADSAPSTACTMSSSCSLRTRHRLGHDATNTTQQGRWPAHNHAMTSLAATVSTCLHMPITGNMTPSVAYSGRGWWG